MKSKKPKHNYCNNKDLVEIIRKWKESGEEKIPEDLAKQFISITEHLLECGKFRGYSENWKSEMKGDALLNLCKYAKNFSLEKSLNPFSYFTQIISNCFRHRLQLEKTRLLQYEKYKNLQDFNIYEVTPGENLQAYSYIENNNTNYNASNQHYAKEEPEKEKKAKKIRMPKNHIGDFFK